MSKSKSIERQIFLADVMITAIEHAGYGFPGLVRWDLDMDREPSVSTATIVDRYAEDEKEDDASPTYITVTLDTIAAGIGVIQRAEIREIVDHAFSDPDRVLHNAKSGQRLYLSRDSRKEILEASKANDAGEIDVVLALAILECALFGAVTYN